MSAAPAVSVALVTRNGMATLPAVLDAIVAQDTPFEIEIVAVDSGSKDGTTELLEGRVHRLVRIPPERFNHGLTRNLAVEVSRGDLVVLMVQDAIPASCHWLEELVRPFAADAGMAGSFARQLPRPQASRLARWSLSSWVAAQPEPRVSALGGKDALAALPPLERLLTCAFDNVCACLRRSVWERIPFGAAAIAEDMEWGRNVLLAGYRIAYVPAATVLHSHDRPVRYELGRTYLVHRRLWELFGLRTIPSVPALGRAIVFTLATHLRVLRVHAGPRPGPREVARAIALAVAWPLGQYLGARVAAGGRDTLRPQGV